MIDRDLTKFIRSSIGSIWALELLLYLRANAGRSWTFDDLIKELRSSRAAILEAAMDLVRAGLAVEQNAQLRYAPASADLDQLAQSLVRAYMTRPVAIVKHIAYLPEKREQASTAGVRTKDKS